MKKKKSDPHMPLTDAEWKNLGPAMHGIDELPEVARKAVMRSRGRPSVSGKPKPTITLRMDEEIIERLREHKGYNAIVESLLRNEIEAGRL